MPVLPVSIPADLLRPEFANALVLGPGGPIRRPGSEIWQTHAESRKRQIEAFQEYIQATPEFRDWLWKALTKAAEMLPLHVVQHGQRQWPGHDRTQLCILASAWEAGDDDLPPHEAGPWAQWYIAGKGYREAASQIVEFAKSTF